MSTQTCLQGCIAVLLTMAKENNNNNPNVQQNVAYLQNGLLPIKRNEILIDVTWVNPETLCSVKDPHTV